MSPDNVCAAHVITVLHLNSLWPEKSFLYEYYCSSRPRADIHRRNQLAFVCFCLLVSGVALQSLVSTLKGDPHGAVAPADTTVASTAAGPSLSTACPSASETEVLRRAYGKGSPIHKYLDLARADFAESFELLPQDANILDPRLMGPNFMNERVRLRMPAGGGRGQDVLDEVLAMVMQAVGRQAGDMGWDRVGMRRGHRGRLAEGNLSPEAPLAQLLWQTLLPWNVFPTPSNPPPPPPPWL